MCTTCKENAEPVPYVATPIFWSVVKDMREAGHDLPWHRIFKPSGTIGILSDISYGIHATYGAMVRNPNAAVVIKGLDLS